MTPQNKKPLQFLPLFICVSFVFFFSLSASAFASDIQAILDTNNGTSGLVVQSLDTTGKVRILSNGNVGINTVTPQSSLEIIKSTTFVPLMVSSAVTSHGDYFTITSSGNIGIGSTAPSQVLDVNGDVRIGLGTFNNPSTNADLYVTGNLEVDGNTYLGDNAAVDNLTVMGHFTQTGVTDFDTIEIRNSAYVGTSGGNLGIGTTAADASIEVVKQSTNPLLMLSSAAANNGDFVIVTSGGNVGIGSLAPSQLLDINGDVRIGLGTFNNPSTNADLYVTGNLEVDGNVWLGDATADRLTVTGKMNLAGGVVFDNLEVTTDSFLGTGSAVGNVGIGTTSADADLEIVKGSRTSPLLMLSNAATGNGDYMIVDSSGNVGIGTVSPQGVFHAAGTDPAFLFERKGFWKLHIESTSGEPELYTESTSGSSDGYLLLQQSSTQGVGIGGEPGSAKLFVSGNVGIGSTAPGDKLDVNGDVRIGLGTFNNPSTNADLYVTGNLEVDGNTYLGDDASVDNLTVMGKMNMSGSMSLDNLEVTNNTFLGTNSITSNVGIGTTIADGELEIVKGSRTSPLLMLSNTAAGNGDYLIVNSTGNVGIGSLAPSSLLDINGDVRIGLGTFNNPSTNADLFVTGNLEVDGSVWLGDATTDNLTVTGKMSLTGGTTFDNVEVTTNTFLGTGSDVGNVGIGTTAADADLEIVKGTRTSPLFMLSNAPAGNGDYLIVNSTGNVGIGSLTPSAVLDVNGDVRIGLGTFNNPSTNADLYVTGNLEVDGNTYLGDNAAVDNLTVLGKMNMTGSMGLDNLEVTNNTFLGTGSSISNVGIGTTAADGALEIVKGSRTTPLLMVSNAAAGNGDYLIVDSVGNVGIGSAAPAQKLDVAGNVAIPLNSSVWLSSSFDTGISEVTGGNIEYTLPSTGTRGHAFKYGSSVAMFIKNDGNVGIGSLTPGSKLDINGDVRIGLGTFNNPSTNADLFVTGNLEVDGNVWLGDATTDNLTVTGRMNLTGGVGFDNLEVTNNTFLGTGSTTSNVGIGTTAADGALEIVKGSRTTPLLMVSNAAAGNGDYLIVDSTGNVGIGSVNPVEMLNLYGTSDVDIDQTFVGASNAQLHFKRAAAGTTIVSNGNGLGVINFAGYDGTAYVRAARIEGVVNGTPGAGNMPGALIFKTTPIGSATVAERMRIDNAGNVGIGSTDPGDKLDVNGDVRIGLGTFNNPSTNADLYVSGNLEVDGNTYLGDNAAVDNLTVMGKMNMTGSMGLDNLEVTNNTFLGTGSAISNVGIGTTAADASLEIVKGSRTSAPLMISNAAAGNGDYLMVDSTGNVGIGTITLPSTYLHLYKSDNSGSSLVKIENPNSGANAFSEIDVAGDASNVGGFGLAGSGVAVSGGTFDGGYVYLTTNSVASGINITAKKSTGTLKFFTGGSVAANERMRIDSTGNIGIGSANPGSMLDINGDVRIGLGTFNNPSTNADLFVTGNLEVDGSVWLGDATTDNLTVTGKMSLTGGTTFDNVEVTNNTFLGTGSTTGNVGIGTTAADGALEIVKGSRTSAPLMVSNAAAGNGDYLIVDSTGNVGLGTAIPATHLDIKGSGQSATVSNSMINLQSTDAFGPAIRFSGTGSYDGRTWRIGAGASGNTILGANSANKFGIMDDSVSLTRFVIDSNGNVGIGTTSPFGGFVVTNGNVGIGSLSPGSMLDVNGDVRIGLGTFNNPSTNADLFVTGNLEVDGSVWLGDATTDNLTVTGKMSLTGGTTFDNVEVTNNTFLGTASTTGNVGIGSTAADAALEIVKGSRTAPLFMVSNTAAGNGDYLIVNSNGNVGIGTAAPQSKLQIENTLNSTSIGGGELLRISAEDGNTLNAVNELSFSSYGVSNPDAIIGGKRTNVSGFGYSDLYFATRAASANAVPIERMRIAAVTGNVGIGTLAPGSKLSVSGGASIGSNTNYVSAAAPTDGLMVQGNVGIGSITPGSALDVNGDVRIGLGTFNNPSTNADLFVTGNLEVDGSVWLGDATTDNLTVTGKMNLTGGTTFDNVEVTNNTFLGTASTTGNVGIGSTAADAALEIVKGSRTAPLLMVSNAAAGNGDYLIVNSSGNVGIGSSNPATFQFEMTGSAPNMVLTRYSADASGPVFRGRKARGTPGAGAAINARDNLVSLIGGGSNDGSGFADTARITAVAEEDFSGTSRGTGWQFVTSSLGSTSLSERMRINANGNIGIGTFDPFAQLVIASGNVGIGSLAPGSALDVNGDVRIGLGTFNNPSTNADLFVTGNLEVDGSVWLGDATTDNLTVTGKMSLVGGTTFDNIEVTTNAFFSTSGSGNVGIGSTVADASLEIVKQSTEPYLMLSATAAGNGDVVMVTSSGNVGIGTAIPGGKLDVWGTTGTPTAGDFTVSDKLVTIGRISGTGGDNTNFLVRDRVGTRYIYADTTLHTLALDTYNTVSGLGNNALNITTTGNIGIATFTPNAVLDITTTIAQDLFVVNDNGAGDTSPFIIKSDGNVGIGTTTPGRSFVVVGGTVGIGTWTPGGAHLLDAYGIVGFPTIAVGDIPNAGNPLVYMQADAVNGLGIFETRSNHPLVLAVNDIEKVRVLATGNVGIATFAPTAFLDISSTASQDLFRVNDNGAGDTTPFVIESNGNVGIGTFNPNKALLQVGAGDPSTAGANDVYFKNNLEVGGTIYGNVFNAGTNKMSTLEVTGDTFLNTGGSGNVGIGSTVADASLEIVKQSTEPYLMLSATAAGNGDVLMVNSAGNVGIGSTNPGFPLSINSSGGLYNSAIYHLGIFASTSSGPQILLSGGGAYDGREWSIVSGGSGNPNVGLGKFGIIDRTAGIARFVIDSAGNIGIGTAWPSGLLEVGAQKFNVLSTGNVGIGTTTPAGALTVMNGNVGIGTWAPDSALSIMNGNIGIGTAAISKSYIFSPTAAAYSFIQSGLTTGQAAFVSAGDIGSGTGHYGEVFYENSGAANTQLTLIPDSYNVYAGTAATGGITLMTNTTAPIRFATNGTAFASERMRIDSSGNVGIGTTAPRALFDVTGTVGSLPVTVTVSGNIGIGTWLPAQRLVINEGGSIPVIQLTNGAITHNIGRASNFLATGGTTDLGLSAAASTSLLLGISSSEKMRIDSSGNIGIGTITPGQLLDIQGTVRTTGNGDMILGSGTFNNPSTSSDLYVTGNLEVDGNVYLGDAVADTLTVTGTTNYASMEVTGDIFLNTGGSGNVGIGSNAADASLEIVKQGTEPYLMLSATAAGNGNILMVNSAGNVGIGTTAPEKKLEITGSSAATTTAAQILLTDTAANVNSRRWTIANSYAANYGDLSFAVGNSNAAIPTVTKMTIDLNGNVGIGTIFPSSLLEVGAQKFNVLSSGNVGIGTNVPSAPLHIKSDGTALYNSIGGTVFVAETSSVTGPNVWLGGVSPYDGRLWSFLASGSANSIVGGAGKFALIDRTAGVPRFLVDANGNIGIGTINTPALLSIGAVAGELTTVNDQIILTSQGRASQIIASDISNTAGEPGGAYTEYSQDGPIGTGSIARVGLTQIVNQDPSGALLTGALVNSFVISAVNSATSIQLGVGNNVIQTITATNVGIGTVTPGQLLDVQGTVRVLNNGDVIVGGGTFNNPSTSSDLYVTGNLEVDGNVYLGDAITDTLTVTGNTSYASMEVTGNIFLNTGGSGNVGIGSTVADASLEIVKQSTEPYLMLSATAAGNGDVLMVNSAGNVGIGTTLPAAVLDVEGAINAGTSRGINLYADSNTSASALGGSIAIAAGSSTGSSRAGGSVAITAGNGGANQGAAGTFAVTTGTGGTNGSTLSADGGPISLTTGPGGGATAISKVSGAINLVTGNAVGTLDGSGNIKLQTGSANGGGATGSILFNTAGTTERMRVDGSGNVGINTTIPAATLDVKGSLGVITITKTANYTATASDYAILVNTTTGSNDVTIALPAAAGVPGRTYVIKKVDASIYNVIIDPSGAETIEGAATYTFNTQYQAVTIVCDGTQWWII